MKTTDKMDWKEFIQWANEYAVDGFLRNGLSGMKDAIHTIIIQTLYNEVWGGSVKKSKKKK